VTGEDSPPLLAVEHLQLQFPIRRGALLGREAGRVHAVDDVTFELRDGETVGLVGESGCGKSTLSRVLLRLLKPTGGAIRYRGRDVTTASRRELEPVRRELQMVFQDPFASLNPRRTVEESVAFPLRLHGSSRAGARQRARELLESVGLSAAQARRYPHEFSGGQRQRVGIARALALEPSLLVLDEPVSALDVSVQAQIVNLLEDLQDRLGLAYLFVAHDLSVVRHVSDRIAVMYLGKLMEVSPAEELYAKPIHPYTDALLGAVPIPDPRESRARSHTPVRGEPPSAADPPPGCVFHTRCPRATAVCRSEEPPLTEYPSGHLAACHHPLSVSAEEVASATRSPASPIGAGEALPRVA
jgi:oligopeptide/dipeptide ABC transporter ATP-binding protein